MFSTLKENLQKLQCIVYQSVSKKWWIMGSGCDKKRQSKRNVLTEEKVKDVQTQSSVLANN
jgi:hypothetical protein